MVYFKSDIYLKKILLLQIPFITKAIRVYGKQPFL